MAFRKFTTIATTIRSLTLLESIQRFFFGPERKADLHLRHLALLLLSYQSKLLPAKTPTLAEVSSLVIAKRIRTAMEKRPKHVLDALLIDYTMKEDFMSRLEYFQGRYGALLVSAAAPRAREIGQIVCAVLGKLNRMLSINSPLVNRREFSHAVLAGFPSMAYPANPGRVPIYLSPYMDIKDVIIHLSHPGNGLTDTRQDLNVDISKLTLNLAITAIQGLEMAEDHYGASPAINSATLKRNVQFLLRTSNFDKLPDHIMERADIDLHKLAEEVYDEYDKDAGAGFRRCVQEWQSEAEEAKEAKEVAVLRRRLKKVLKREHQNLLKD